jgi:hypothetical protein
VSERDGIDPLYDLGPLPGGDILFRPGGTDDVGLPSGATPLPVTSVGTDTPAAEPPVTRAAAAPRRMPPPQTYRPTPSPQPIPPSPSQPVDLRRGGGRARPGRTAGGSSMTLLRWAVRHPRAAIGAAFAVVALVSNAVATTSGSVGSGGDPFPPGPGGDPGPVVVDAGADGMTYQPELVPGSVAQWRIVVDNLGDGDADYRIEDVTTGEVLGAGTNPAGGSAEFTVPADRLGDRVSIVQDATSGSGSSGCHVLADDTEVATAESDAGLTCTYDPASLQR